MSSETLGVTSHDATSAMDGMYRYQRHIYDLTRKYYLLGRDRMIARLAPHAGDAVLEIGCGTGRNLIVAASTFPQARLFGVDVSTARSVADAGATLLVSSHVMDEAQRCDQVMVMRAGRLLAHESPTSLQRRTETTDLDAAFLELIGAATVPE